MVFKTCQKCLEKNFITFDFSFVSETNGYKKKCVCVCRGPCQNKVFVESTKFLLTITPTPFLVFLKKKATTTLFGIFSTDLKYTEEFPSVVYMVRALILKQESARNECNMVIIYISSFIKQKSLSKVYHTTTCLIYLLHRHTQCLIWIYSPFKQVPKTFLIKQLDKNFTSTDLHPFTNVIAFWSKTLTLYSLCFITVNVPKAERL